MDVARTLREARQAAGLTQRQLAARAGVPQSTVARIERGQMTPRVDKFERLLHATEHEVIVRKKPGFGLDRTQIREVLRLTPDQRLNLAVVSARNVARLMRRAKLIGTK
jgi:transcriptional regulator with XRE-family HTH domain